MADQSGWFERFMKHQTKRAKRKSPEQFAAYRWTGSTLKQEPVRDISESGVFVQTKDALPIGSFVSLVLQHRGPLVMNPEQRVVAQATVIRTEEDGVGLSFIWPKDPEPLQWSVVLSDAINKLHPSEMLDLVRMAAAFAFLSRICPNGAGQVGLLLRDRLSNNKIDNLISIALYAEGVQRSSPSALLMRANPSLLVRSLEEASRTEDATLQRLWGGLIVASCSLDGKDDSSLPLVQILSQNSTTSARILTFVCSKASSFLASDGSIAANPLLCKLDEVRSATGSRELQIEQEFRRLDSLGLLERQANGRTLALLPSQETSLTASTLGLELFARCNGHHGPLKNFYSLDPPASLAPAR